MKGVLPPTAPTVDPTRAGDDEIMDMNRNARAVFDKLKRVTGAPTLTAEERGLLARFVVEQACTLPPPATAESPLYTVAVTSRAMALAYVAEHTDPAASWLVRHEEQFNDTALAIIADYVDACQHALSALSRT